jgi:putative membrane protein
MVATTHWLWHLPQSVQPAFVERVFLSNLFYGMPLTNWLGWLLTGFVIAYVMLVVVRPSVWTREVSPTRLPLVLYAVNGLFPILICVGRHMWAAVILGALAMAIPLVLAMRRVAHAASSAQLAAATAGD